MPVRQLYGCTETGTLTANIDDDPVATFESVGGAGRTASRSLIEDDDGRAVPVGEVGEVTVRSPAA